MSHDFFIAKTVPVSNQTGYSPQNKAEFCQPWSSSITLVSLDGLFEEIRQWWFIKIFLGLRDTDNTQHARKRDGRSLSM